MRRESYVPHPREVRTPEERRAAKREVRRLYRERKGAEVMRAYNRAYLEDHRDRHNARGREFRRSHPGYGTDAARLAKRARPEHYRAKGRENAARRRARLALVVVLPFTLEQLDARLAYFGWSCWMCGGEWTTLDHVKPISRGGPHMLSNIRPACKSCNSAKGARWPFAVASRT